MSSSFKIKHMKYINLEEQTKVSNETDKTMLTAIETVKVSKMFLPILFSNAFPSSTRLTVVQCQHSCNDVI